MVAFDINAAGSGLVYGLAIADSILQTAGYKSGLVTPSEKMSMFTIITTEGPASFLKMEPSHCPCRPRTGSTIFSRLNWGGGDASGSEYVKMGAREGEPYFWRDGQKVFWKFGANHCHSLWTKELPFRRVRVRMIAGDFGHDSADSITGCGMIGISPILLIRLSPTLEIINAGYSY